MSLFNIIRRGVTDTVAPIAPVITQPASAETTRDNKPQIGGTAEASSTVMVYDIPVLIGTILADSLGNWLLELSTALTDGSHSLRATATDPYSNVSPNSATVTITVDTTAPLAPVISSPVAGTLANASQIVSGTSEAGSTIEVYENGSILGTTTTGATGNWSLGSKSFPDGLHTLSVQSIDSLGNISAQSSVVFTMATGSVIPQITKPAIGQIVFQSTGILYEGTAPAGSGILIKENALVLCSTTTNALGKWSCNTALTLTDGAHGVTAQSVIAAVTSSRSATRSYTIDTVPAVRAPIYAYYYIWFDPTSWDRAKLDYPQLGRYDSSDEVIIRQHIAWAKGCGIEGWILGWKQSTKLNARLTTLLRVADELGFKIIMLYQGLDFYRNPLPITQVNADLDYFIANHMNHACLNVGKGKPLFLWSGSWEFLTADIQATCTARAASFNFLTMAKDVVDYERTAAFVNGNAYYWSSVNIDTNTQWEPKLRDFAVAVHAHAGIWICPFEPGYNATLIGGTTVIPRGNGDTLTRQLAGVRRNDNEFAGLISWNEFSENTYVEPSLTYGTQYIDLLRSLNGL